jgi:hypothetical protein
VKNLADVRVITDNKNKFKKIAHPHDLNSVRCRQKSDYITRHLFHLKYLCILWIKCIL